MFKPGDAGAAARERRMPEMLLDATVNGVGPSVSIQPICLASGRLALTPEDWKTLGFRLTRETVLPDGRRVFPLESIGGIGYRVDTLAQTIAITAPASAFDGSKLSGQNKLAVPPPPPTPGGYITYDASLQYTPGEIDYGTSLNATIFGPWGLFLTGGTVTGDSKGGLTFTRADTYWQRSDPTDMSILTVGETVGVGGAWSRPVRFIGIQYERDFTTRPGFITYPMPSVHGSAALPSTVQVLVNDQQRLMADVAPGPFDITNVPVLSGSGQLQVVVNNALGRQVVVTQNYYAAPQMLAPGLTDFAYEAGFERLNYGASGFDYGHFIADGTYRRGVADWLTVEGRAEAETTRAAAGGALWTDAGAFGVLEATAGWSVTRTGETGGDYLVSFQSVRQHLGFTASWQYFSSGYRPYAYSSSETLPRMQVMAGGSLPVPHVGPISLNYTYQSQWGAASNEFVTASWSRTLGRFNVSLSGDKDLLHRAWTASLGITMAMGTKTASTNATVESGSVAAFAQVSTPTPTGPGYGWTVRADSESRSVDASGVFNATDVTLSGDLAASLKGVSGRAEATGSVGLLGGYIFASRPITTGFAVVRTGDVAGAPILLWNRPAAVTGKSGYALIPELGPWEDNRISTDANALPIDVEVDADSVTTRLWPHSGVFVDFPIRRSRAAMIVLRQANGEPVPLGATVILRPGKPASLVADDGDVWLTDLVDHNRVEVAWDDGACTAQFDAPASLGTAARIGPISCVAKK